MSTQKQKQEHRFHDHGQDTASHLSSMPSQASFDEAADTFQLISDSTRLKIVWILYRSEECVTNIAVAIDMSSPAVSHHLRVLKQSGLIKSRRIGKEAHYSIADNPKASFILKAINEIFRIE